MKRRLLLAAVTAGLLLATTGTSSAWVVKCTREWRAAWNDGAPTVPATTRYVECLA